MSCDSSRAVAENIGCVFTNVVGCRYICALLRKIPSLKSITLSDFYVAPEFVTNIKEQAPCTSKLQGQLWTVTVAEKKVDGGLSEFNLMWQRT